MATTAVDVESAVGFLKTLFGPSAPGFIGLWTLQTKESYWYKADHPDECARGVSRFAPDSDLYVHLGLQARPTKPRDRGQSVGVIAVPGLWLDLDYADAVHKKPNLPPDEDAALDFLAELPFPPTLVIHSGHGLQAYWLWRELWVFDDKAEHDRAANIGRRWTSFCRDKAKGHGWDVDSTHDLARIFRIPGTLNHKDKSAAAIQVATMRQDLDRRYNPSDFDEFLPAYELAGSENGSAPTGDFVVDSANPPPFEKFAAAMAATKFRKSWTRSRDDLQDQSGSGYDQSLANMAHMMGWAPQETIDLLIAAARKHGGDIKSRSYYEHTLGVAWQTEITPAVTPTDSVTQPPHAAPAPSPLTWLTARQIAEQTPEQVDWVVWGYIARGAITDWSAKVKTGKTSLMLVCARCVVIGEPFLGLATSKGAVVILTEERPPSFRSALGRWGLLDSDDVHVLYRREARGMEWPDIIAAAVGKCLEVGAVLLVIDTFADWAQFGADQENDAGAASEAMLPVQSAAEQGIAVLMSRHDRKSGGEIGESARGSSAVAGKADILVSIRRADGAGHERRRVIVAVGRFDDTPEQLVVELNQHDQYIALGDALDVERQEARARVLDIVPASAPGFSFDEILDKSPGHARSTLLRAVKELDDERQISSAKGAGPSKRAKGYFRPSLENIPTPRSGGMFDLSASDKEGGSDVNVRSAQTNIPTSDPLWNKGWNVVRESCNECEDNPVTYDAITERPLCVAHAPHPPDALSW